jgi:hypothetical protein
MSASGDDIIPWAWPVNEADLDRFIREAAKVLREAGG